jgi:hypothetical protein
LATKCGLTGHIFAVHNELCLRVSAKGGKTMTSAVAALGIAVAATSALCYALLTRAGKFRRNRWPPGDNAADGGSSSGSEGWAAASWFGGHHSATDSLGNSSDFGGGDSGDGGGGGD